MWNYVLELRDEGRTVFMTTHYMEEAEHLCDKICIIDNGKIIALDSVEGVIEFADIDNMISFETDEDIVPLISEGIEGINRIEKENQRIKIYSKREDILTDLIILLKDRNINYRKMDINRPGLEDAFLKLTGKAWKEGAQ